MDVAHTSGQLAHSVGPPRLSKAKNDTQLLSNIDKWPPVNKGPQQLALDLIPHSALTRVLRPALLLLPHEQRSALHSPHPASAPRRRSSDPSGYHNLNVVSKPAAVRYHEEGPLSTTSPLCVGPAPLLLSDDPQPAPPQCNVAVNSTLSPNLTVRSRPISHPGLAPGLAAFSLGYVA